MGQQNNTVVMEINFGLLIMAPRKLAFDHSESPLLLPSLVIACRIFTPLQPAPSISVLNPTNRASSGSSVSKSSMFIGPSSSVTFLMTSAINN